MKTEVLVAERVRRYVRSLAPQPRQALNRAIKALARDEGDITSAWKENYPAGLACA
jgi:hypothetical protein